MSTNVKLPELGEGVTEGEIVKWLVKPGDSVKADQSILEMMTDKATVEVPSPVAGVVKELKFKQGETIKVDSVILVLDAAGAAASPAPVASAPAKSAPAAAAAPAAGPSAPKNVKLPELGEGVTEGEIVKWLVKPGDTVKADQSILEMMTDKATVEVPSPFAGVVKELKFKQGETIKVDSVILVLDAAASAGAAATNGAAPAAPAAANKYNGPAASVAPMSASAQSSSAGLSVYPPAADFRVLATPSTRRLAREFAVDINGLTGSGLAGRVTREDVLQAKGTGAVRNGASASQPQSAAASSAAGVLARGIPKPAFTSNQAQLEERVELKGIRKKIAENLQMAKAIIPHFTIMDEADVTELVKLRESLKEQAEKAGTKITYLPFVMKALVATLREFPQFNASIDDANSQIVYKKYFNLGFAADTPNGLLVPVIKNADQKTILQLSQEIIDLSKRARDGKLKPDEMKGATITITNIGSVGGTYATPIINHPEVAILGMYKISEKPVIRNGQLAAIKVMNYTVTADHRLIDGAVAANFLKAFMQRLSNPGVLMLDMF
ncbi:MAG: dihydrolipoyllysine-residue acetyltransferase [Pseudobdellovibrionaceae bacterium]